MMQVVGVGLAYPVGEHNLFLLARILRYFPEETSHPSRPGS
jgi:hypothetical protein